MEVKGLLSKVQSMAPPRKASINDKSSRSIGLNPENEFAFRVGFQTPTSQFRKNRNSVKEDFQKMNNLAELLSPGEYGGLNNDVSVATLKMGQAGQMKLRRDMSKETWMQKLQKGGTVQTNKQKLMLMRNRA